MVDYAQNGGVKGQVKHHKEQYKMPIPFENNFFNSDKHQQ
ncbi:hypothetical protein ADICYQ_5728 [Cyclobacterium qasimii M12-11B]|uniref:Uncharacterized protein n=1 Tax=Cyclobacterium qasimii M12-11B TaxID=641524 RepID=S7V519_9BACT|nr:hypothetical protein ADICYQ_5728 [Cyclobacterium qasimii M12-11B]